MREAAAAGGEGEVESGCSGRAARDRRGAEAGHMGLGHPLELKILIRAFIGKNPEMNGGVTPSQGRQFVPHLASHTLGPFRYPSRWGPARRGAHGLSQASLQVAHRWTWVLHTCHLVWRP